MHCKLSTVSQWQNFKWWGWWCSMVTGKKPWWFRQRWTMLCCNGNIAMLEMKKVPVDCWQTLQWQNWPWSALRKFGAWLSLLLTQYLFKLCCTASRYAAFLVVRATYVALFSAFSCTLEMTILLPTISYLRLQSLRLLISETFSYPKDIDISVNHISWNVSNQTELACKP